MPAFENAVRVGPEPSGGFAPAKTLRILIADDHAVVREGLLAILKEEPEWEVCGVATNGREAVEMAKRLRPDLAILDISMPEMNGLEAMDQIKRAVPGIEMLALSAHQSEDVIEQVFKAGAKSYILKGDASRLLIGAIRSLQNHKPYFTDGISEMLFYRFLATGPKREEAGSEKLTAREAQVIRHIADGKSNRETAETLGISVRTVENHRAAVMRKLRLDSLADVVRYAIRHGIIEA